MKAIVLGKKSYLEYHKELFNIFICDLFILIDDINIVNYADDNISLVSGDTPLNVITSLENAAEKLFEWFGNN